MILIVVPSHVLRSAITRITFKELKHGAVVVSATKGIEIDTLLRMSEVIENTWEGIKSDNIVALSGPSLSAEVNVGIPTTVVSASSSIETAQWVQKIFFAPLFRVYASDDVVGVELGGALKNVIAIAAGISDGLGFGNNAKGALLTRGLSEIARLGVLMGGREKTFSGLSGMGDLITTCGSNLSRNHTVGYKIGKGLKLKEVVGGMLQVAEGVNTTKAAMKLAGKYDFKMPIVEAVNSILFEDKDPRDAVNELMIRTLKIED
jgi:glycerol-3-phosphate dehydrogenase (NAD(P)+)